MEMGTLNPVSTRVRRRVPARAPIGPSVSIKDSIIAFLKDSAMRRAAKRPSPITSGVRRQTATNVGLQLRLRLAAVNAGAIPERLSQLLRKLAEAEARRTDKDQSH